MSRRFEGKIVLVSGGGSGIGRATALAFAREGAIVVVAGRRSGPLADTVASIEQYGGQASYVAGDVARAEDAARLVATTVERHGALDVAANLAGVLDATGPIEEIEEAAWRRVLDVNLTGVWLAMKYEIAHMRMHGGGAIVNASSNVGRHMSRPGLAAYGAAKAGVSALTKTAALECIADGIRINAISPGPIDSAMSLRPGETDDDRATRLRDALPIGRVGTLEEAASAVLWLASPESGFAVGHDLVIDGGASA